MADDYYNSDGEDTTSGGEYGSFVDFGSLASNFYGSQIDDLDLNH